MNILITGTTGFIGYNLIKFLTSDKNLSLIVLIRNESDYEKFKDLGVEILKSDILDPQLNEKIDKKIDVIIHLAAITQYYKSKELIFETNYVGTRNLLKCFNNVKQFIFSSTSIINFSNDYAESKLMCEKIIKESGIDYTILRIGPVFGKDSTTGISKIINAVYNDKNIPVPGNGKFEIQPIHINDVINSIKLVITNDQFLNQTLNLVGKSILLENFIEEICKIFNKKNKTKHIPYWALKSFAKIYQGISSEPIITVEQIKILKHGSNLKPDFPLSSIEDGIKKCV